jgi:hypothetical protein
MPKIPPGEEEFSEFMRRNRMINEDERFKEAMLVAHPDIRVGIHTDLCTDNPQFMAPVVTIRSGDGFDYTGTD